MSVLDWLIIGCLSITILSSIFALFFLYSYVTLRKKNNKIAQKRPKNKQKRRKWKRQLRLLAKRKKSTLIKIIIFLVLLFSSLGGALYCRYYQSINLGTEDQEIISQTYFILDEVSTELKNIQNGSNVDKTQEKLKDMLSVLVSYTSRTPSTSLSIEGQQQLRYYYTRTREFGTNLYGQTSEQLSDKTKVAAFQSDISELEKKQAEIFKEFHINKESIRAQNKNDK